MQVWWAKRWVEVHLNHQAQFLLTRDLLVKDGAQRYLDEWKKAPWYGHWGVYLWSLSVRGSWRPRRVYYEYLKYRSGLDLGNDPSAWEAWFKAHPNLVWDPKLKRLVEPKS